MARANTSGSCITAYARSCGSGKMYVPEIFTRYAFNAAVSARPAWTTARCLR
jgi:hypothetical protein